MYSGLTTADKGALLDAKAVGFKVFCETSNGGRVFYSKYPSVSEANSRIISIDLALAQIAEMESAEKPSECGWCNGAARMSGTFWTDKDENCGGTFDFKFCPNCGRNLNSPYMEGATK